MLSLNVKCKTTYKAYHKSGTRQLSVIKWIVMHDTEGGTAEGIAGYFSKPSSGGSAHLVVDDKQCYRCLNDNEVPWGAQGANTKGFHIEQCGFAKWSLVVWKKHLNTLKRAAYKAALHCHKFDIPAVFVTASGLKNGQKGITTHKQCTLAFGGSHTDPGPLWPRPLFMRYVKKYLAEMTNV